MFNPFRMFCFAPDGVPDGAPAADAENEREQHDDQQPETTEQTGDTAAKAAQTAAPAGKEQPVPKDEPKKDDKADDLAARVVTTRARFRRNFERLRRWRACRRNASRMCCACAIRRASTLTRRMRRTSSTRRLPRCWKPCRSCAAARVRAARATLPAETAAQRTRSTQRFGRTSWALAKLRKRGKEDGEQHCKG